MPHNRNSHTSHDSHHPRPLKSPDGLRHLFVTDLDGTLLDDTARVSPATAEILSWLVERGVMFTVATARTPATVERLFRNIPPSPSLPLIVMTGAAMWNRVEGCYESCHFLEPSMAEAVMNVCLSNGIHPFVYRFAPDDNRLLHVYHSPRLQRKEIEFLDERRHLPLKRFHLVDDASVVETPLDGTLLFFTTGERNAIYRAADTLRNSLGCAVSAYPDIYHRHIGIMEVFAPQVSMGAAVRDLARRVGADHITVFGDNLNDIAMMECAHTAVAVGNAQPRVKEYAHTVIGPNTADSVARYILRHFTGSETL